MNKSKAHKHFDYFHVDCKLIRDSLLFIFCILMSSPDLSYSPDLSVITFWLFYYHRLTYFHLHLRKWLARNSWEWRWFRICLRLFYETIFRHKNTDAFFPWQANILVLEFMGITFMDICPSELICNDSLWGQTTLRILKSFWNLLFALLLSCLFQSPKNGDELFSWIHSGLCLIISALWYNFCNRKV